MFFQITPQASCTQLTNTYLFKVQIIAIQTQMKVSRTIKGLFYAFLHGPQNDQMAIMIFCTFGINRVTKITIIYSVVKIHLSNYFNSI